MNITETPDKWVVIKTPHCYKVYATWNVDDRWKINSGIVVIEKDDDYYYFEGHSGSCYKCGKKDYGIATVYGAHFIADIIAQTGNMIEILDDIEDWTTLNLKEW